MTDHTTSSFVKTAVLLAVLATGALDAILLSHWLPTRR